MAAFHPETLRLLTGVLTNVNAQHKRDLEKLAKLHVESRSLMAQKLRSRLAESMPVMRDLQRLIDFAEGVNRLRDEHEHGFHNSHPRQACDGCPDETAPRGIEGGEQP
jgi:hypothetical protein